MTKREELKKLSVRYGAALLIYVLNIAVMPSIYVYPVYWVCGALGINSYIAAMLLNDLTVYFVPLIAFFLLFKWQMPDKSETPQYERVRFEGIMLFAAGLAVSSALSLMSSYLYELLNSLFGFPIPEMAFSSMMPENSSDFLVMLLGTTLIAPLCEEILFRHLLLKPLRRYGDLTAAIVSALFFGLYHANLDQLVYVTVFGFALSLIAIRAGSIVPCVVFHAINNFCVTFISYLPDDLGSETMNSLAAALEFVCVVTVNIFNYGGIAAVAYVALKRLYRLKKPDEDALSTPAQLGVFFSTPAVIISIIACALLFIVNLFG